MPLICDRAICIRKVEFSETSQILALFTRNHGLVRVIAKGAHRMTKAGSSKFDGGLDLLDEGDALFSDRLEKDLNILAEWKLLDGHRGIRVARRPLYLALHVAEILGSVFEVHDPHPGVFDRFVATIDQLATPAREEAILALLLDLLREAGFMPSLDTCVGCDRPVATERTVFYSPTRGGVVCQNCAGVISDRRPIDTRLIAVANSLVRLPRDEKGQPLRLPRLTEAQTDPLHAMLARHLEASAGLRFRLIRQLLKAHKTTKPHAAPASFVDSASTP